MESSRAVIARALGGGSPFVRLGLPEALSDQIVVRRAYHASALLAHPDKCGLPQAKLAFQRISEAFDMLATPHLQQRALEAASRGARACASERGSRDHADDDKDSRGCKWWDASWSEFERRLWQRAEAEREQAVDAAVLRGEDPLDAYMEVLSTHGTRDRGCGDKQEKRGKRPRPSTATASSEAPRRKPFQSAAVGSTRRRHFQPAETQCGVNLKLATGATIAVSKRIQEASAATRACTNVASLEHLDSDGSEMSG